MKTLTIQKSSLWSTRASLDASTPRKDTITEYLKKLDDSLNILVNPLKTHANQLAYQCAYRKTHRRENKIYSAKYYDDHRVKLKKTRRLRYEQNRQTELNARAEYYRVNRVKINQAVRKYYARNRDLIREKSRRYYLKNKKKTTTIQKKLRGHTGNTK